MIQYSPPNLIAYFDESGTHTGSQVSLIAGLIGPRREWAKVHAQWNDIMLGEMFHYKNMRADKEKIAELAEIIACSPLQVVCGAFSGNWQDAVSRGPDWAIRFPSAYHFVFELCLSQMECWAKDHWGDLPVSLVFSQQFYFSKRAREVWRTYRANGLWQRYPEFDYKDPHNSPELQMADMVSYETYRCVNKPDHEWNRWPLMRRLLARNIPLLGGLHTSDTLYQMLHESDQAGRKYLKAAPPAR